MTSPIAGIDPHQDTFTLGIVDQHGVEIAHAAFNNNAGGYIAAIDELVTHGVEQVGIEGSAKWGAHVAIAIVAAGFDAREIPASRSAAQRRSRRLDKTDAIVKSGARTLLAGDLGCLMNMAGKLKRTSVPVEARHVAEVLAGMTDDPAIGEAAKE